MLKRQKQPKMYKIKTFSIVTQLWVTWLISSFRCHTFFVPWLRVTIYSPFKILYFTYISSEYDYSRVVSTFSQPVNKGVANDNIADDDRKTTCPRRLTKMCEFANLYYTTNKEAIYVKHNKIEAINHIHGGGTGNEALRFKNTIYGLKLK